MNSKFCNSNNTSLLDESDISIKSNNTLPDTEITDEDDEYIPIPYIFTLKDIFDKPITLQPELSENCKISCPPFYVLLDHTIAILWTIFSGENTQILQTSHIHWALKFLEGLKDKQNKQTDDIKMAITYLQDILIDMISNLDLCELQKRNEQSISERMQHTYKTTNYCDFECYLNKPDNNDNQNIESNIEIETTTCANLSDKIARCECECRHSTKIDDGQQQQQIQEDDCEEFLSALDDNPPQTLNDTNNTCNNNNSKLLEKKEYPSFILEDMLGKTNPEKLKDIINDTICNSKLIHKDKPTKLNKTLTSNSFTNTGGSKTNQITEDILNWRENQYHKIIKQLQQMSQLDEAFKNINCTASSDIIKKLENFINQPDPHC